MTTSDKSSATQWNFWMRKCLQLASLGEGTTSPNPLVGSVVLDANNNLVGEGFHLKAGEPHAEIVALSQAGFKAKGGTLVVTLEPCCHHGRTPPCTEALLKFGIKKVVIGLQDPDSRVAGRGISYLKEAGIQVISNVLENEVAHQNREFLFRIKTGRPWGILKCAMSIDGRVSLKNGESKWISGKASREFVHALRAKCDAVIVGAGTVRRDNPLLTSRGLSVSEPLRVVLTNSLDLPVGSKIFDTSVAETLIAYGPNVSSKSLEELPKGPQLVQLKSSEPIELLKLLAAKGCNKVLWECGPTLATSALKQNCVQELKIVLAPKILGGIPAMTPLDDLGYISMDEVLSMNNFSFKKLGNDLHLSMFTP
tara:strand:- start:3091 stop:4191 length:1101 start_codon:yes stop_codon:yes gene_type:complete